MTVPTFTKSGSKASVAVKLDSSVFDNLPKNNDLLKTAYLAYLSNSRQNLATTLKRGEVRGGGRKPWKQKGTGRARFGSIRTPIWRGGGITFGPEGNENYSIKLPTKSKRVAVRQALSLQAKDNKLIVVESFVPIESKTKTAVDFINKIGAKGNILYVVAKRDFAKERGVSNLADVKVISAKYLNVFDLLNADTIVCTKESLSIISEWLNPKTAEAKS